MNTVICQNQGGPRVAATIIGVGFTTILSACQSDVILSPTPSVRALDSRQASLASRRFRTIDDEYADLVDKVPGFGGLYYDSNGALTVFLKDTTTAASAYSAISAFRRRTPRQAWRLAEEGLSRTMKVRVARFDFRELLNLYRNAVLPATATVDGITSTDINEALNRIVVGVRDRSVASQLQVALSQSSVPEQAVEIVEFFSNAPGASGPEEKRFGTLRLWDDSTFDAYPNLMQVLRPVPAGARMRWVKGDVSGLCTISYNIARSDDPASYHLSAAHCTDMRSELDSTFVAQPLGSYWTGREVVDPPWMTNASNPDCAPGRVCRFSDVALFKYDAGISAQQGVIAMPWVQTDPNGVYINKRTIYNYGTVVETVMPEVGRWAHMVGQASGHTYSTIATTCEHVPVYIGNVDTGITLLCQIRSSYNSTIGDSGGPVFEALGDGTVLFALGIHWGKLNGYPYFSPLYGALNEVYAANPTGGSLSTVGNAQPGGGSPPTYYANIVGPGTIKPSTSCYWYVSTNVSNAQVEWRVNDQVVGTGIELWHSASTNFVLEVYVWNVDAAGASNSKPISVSSQAPDCFIE